MKKWIAMLLVMCMTMSLFGCGSGEPKETQAAQQGQTEISTQPPQEDSTPKQTQPAVEDWGVESKMFMLSSYTYVYVSFPENPGADCITGMYAKQPDSTIAIFDVYTEGTSPEVDDIKELFPAYGEQVKPMFENYYRFDYDNSSFEAEYDGTETIGSYEVTKFRGVHHYTLEGVEKNCQFVVYAVELHNGGEYAYVMVQDISTDQSQLELIESHAYNMIRSMREE